jgi:hypothetical protein
MTRTLHTLYDSHGCVNRYSVSANLQNAKAPDVGGFVVSIECLRSLRHEGRVEDMLQLSSEDELQVITDLFRDILNVVLVLAR